MTATSAKQDFTFQAEITQLLHLLAHSLYQSREIAIRELVSNASDALDKMRYVSLIDESQRDADPFEIHLELDKDRRTLTIKDNGIGMSRDELIHNLGTIAHSGSLKFLKSLKEGEKANLSLIGQFGVGFYSAFMLADQVTVQSRSYVSSEAWEWQSDGSGTFTVAPIEKTDRGTRVILHLKEQLTDLTEYHRIRSIIKKYSGFVPFPIKIGEEIVNDVKPIWVEPKNQVTEEQHDDFYQNITHHQDEKPLWKLHLSYDSPIQFRALIYCPPTNLESLGFGRLDHGLKLLSKRILVQGDCRELVPGYLRFLHGLVDSEDLPLNVSRETLQDSALIRKIRGILVKAVLDHLRKLADEEPSVFDQFIQQFGPTLKEAIHEDFPNRELVAKLLRFDSSRAERVGERVSFDQYLARAVPDQKAIYYLGGVDLSAVRNNPNLELFRKRGIEVLFIHDPIDEFIFSSLRSYQGHPIKSIDSAELDLPPVQEELDAPKPDQARFSTILRLFKEALGDRVQDVRLSERLTDSPCCLVNSDPEYSPNLQRLLQLTQGTLPAAPRILEVNPQSPLIQRLSALASNPEHHGFLQECGRSLWTNSLLLEGAIPDPDEQVARIQKMMMEIASQRSPLIL